MNASAKIENARTLASLLGLAPDEAATLLNVRIKITIDGTSVAERLRQELFGLLSKTLELTGESGSPAVEILLGNANPETDSPKIYIWLGTDASVVSKNAADKPADCNGRDIHQIILRLIAQYACGFTLRQVLQGLPNGPDQMKLNFRRMIGIDPNLLLRRVDFGDFSTAGVGAIGTWTKEALTFLDVDGNGYLCDDDNVSGGNLQRYGVFTHEDIGQNKAERASLKLQDKYLRLKLHPCPMRFADAVKIYGNKLLRKVLVAVDSRIARRNIQAELPNEVYDASTTGIREIVLHFSKAPLEKACLCCVYKEVESEQAHQHHIAEVLGIPVQSVLNERLSKEDVCLVMEKYPTLSFDELVGLPCATLFKQLCGQGKIATAEEKHELTPFAFVSAMAGTYLALEFFKRHLGIESLKEVNEIRVNPWRGPDFERRIVRPIDPECKFHGSKPAMDTLKSVWSEEVAVTTELSL